MTPISTSFYETDLTSAALSKAIVDWHGFAYLKSADGNSNSQNCRFDIITACPSIVTSDKSKLTMEATVCELQPKELSELPFLYGWIGGAAYPQAPELNLNAAVNYEAPATGNFFAFYDWSYCFDHKKRKGWLIFSPECDQELKARVLALSSQDFDTQNNGLKEREPKNTPARLSDLPWHKSQSLEQYLESFRQIQEYIHAGDCYQVNLTQRFETNSELSATELLRLFEIQSGASTAGFCAFLRTADDLTVLSFSPERFLSIQNRFVSTSPIKGTVKSEGELSQEQKSFLLSEKNKAENIMIVDLLRNDLSKSCTLNSVKADRLFEIQSFENVHHLVSTITGKLKSDETEIKAFWNAFPGGSITGAPKIRAMEIIDELEEFPRSFYCGSIFYWDIRGNLDSNILIRTVVATDNKLFCWGGGGIVADSEEMSEYQESIDKVRHITGINS